MAHIRSITINSLTKNRDIIFKNKKFININNIKLINSTSNSSNFNYYQNNYIRHFSVSNDNRNDTENIEVTRINKKIVPWPIQKMKSYGELSKFRLSSLVVLTSGAGFICAGSPVLYDIMAATCIGTGLCAASASTFNQLLEIDRDASMKRTCNRPLPSGRVGKFEAAAFGTACGVAGTSMLYITSPPIVAVLGASNIFLYSIIYTLSKPRSEINTWIGSLVGAIPPLMGWTAATSGALMMPEPVALASILFLWQFPHFFALSWMHREDYSRGNFEMVAVNDPVGDRSADLIMRYSLYLSALPLITCATGLTSWMFAVEGTVANLYLLSLARNFKNDKSNSNARKIFLMSLWYLPLLLAGYVFHSRMWKKNYDTEDKIVLAVDNTREALKGICLHELIINNNVNKNITENILLENSIENNSYKKSCMKIATSNAINSATDSINDVSKVNLEVIKTKEIK